MGRRLEYEVKTSVRLNMSNPQHVKINDVIQNLDPKIFKSKNQFIIDAIQFYIDNYGKETFVIKKKEKERAEYIRSEDIDDIKEEVIEAATNEAIEQREGRGIRQGNENEEVAIYRYVTKGTFDAYNWSLVENKQRFISQVMTSKAVSRSCEDIDEATLSYAEINTGVALL